MQKIYLHTAYSIPLRFLVETYCFLEFFVMLQPWDDPAIISHTQNLLRSFQSWFNQDLLKDQNTRLSIAQQLFEAPFVVLSHDGESDPILNYGNRRALQLWERDWSEFTRMPSRLTAEPNVRDARSQLLAMAAQQGCLKGYTGVRISKTGKRFLIEDAMLWDVLDEAGHKCGQAATFEHWQPLP